MGHNSKKKKKKRGSGGGGGGGGGGGKSKDRPSHAGDDQDLLSEELTALGAIFQDDFKIISDSPHVKFLITLRCLPGYPHKCPKIQIRPETGLSKDDTDRLCSLLLDQELRKSAGRAMILPLADVSKYLKANVNAREGRVMIFNLVEAAQEFLSEIAPVEVSHESVPVHLADKDQWQREDVSVDFENNCHIEDVFVYGLIDLFSDLCGDTGSWNQEVGRELFSVDLNKVSGAQSMQFDKIRGSISVSPHIFGSSSVKHGTLQKPFHNTKAVSSVDVKHSPVQRPATELDILEEVCEIDSKSTSPKDSDTSTLPGASRKDIKPGEQTTEMDGNDLEGKPLDLSSSVSPIHDKKSLTEKKDLLLVHLLHLACSSKGALTRELPEISMELYNLGLSSPISQFWKANVEFSGDNASSLNSRYRNDFEEICSLGRGGFGHVVLCKNKLDGRQYAVKKIFLKDKNLPINDKILREVATLSRLQHQHVVRYYQAWFETEVGGCYGDNTWGSRTAESSSCSYTGAISTNSVGFENKQESTFLYIQMEYCPRTLRQVFESFSGLFDKEVTWHLFRQIVEGLAHIHSQGIIHRDLTPNNIFFDARNDIKIGDFGLAKFLKLEQLDHDQNFTVDATGVSMDGTGQVGTYFYTAPEIEQGWPQINEKVDMYSLGVVFFELWHPFSTAMERYAVFSDLKQKGLLPPAWVAEFPEQASLLRRLMASSPSDRPSATELLHHALPPRMEDEWLNDILRTMQTAEDSYVYDRVVSTIFDEEKLIARAHRQHGTRGKISRDESSFTQYTELETELRDDAIDVAKEVCRQHGAKRLEITPMRVMDDSQPNNRFISHSTYQGNMLELCHELRSPFVSWVVAHQKLSFKRYEISWVHRRAIGHSTPYRFLQGDFDIIGGAPGLTEAEVVKVAMDILNRYCSFDAFDIRLNHGHLLDAIWSWVGIEGELRKSVAEDLNLAKSVVDRLQTVDLRFCGSADQALARLRGALSPDKNSRKALEELSELLSYLRVWRIEGNISIDVFMPPTDSYYRDLFFQIYLTKENNSGSFSEGTLLAAGGRYDYLVHQLWTQEYKTISPGAVGVSLALEKILHHPLIRPFRNEPGTGILICSRGGGGLLEERMELVADLWDANIKAEFVPSLDPSFTEQYEYASEHDIKCLVILTEAGLSQQGSVMVRHLDYKNPKEVKGEELIKFLMDSMSMKFRNFAPQS
ncbi:putative serine/threonine-protein kinase GCN2 [Acorus calamus]|uniref:Serine/threonine-protein kinase GCN2 n=1 Tax=Acorus calamus TaxID=4465 RepID=A0AAV9D1H6_ACOCL|nr:putative serine/threonine-protein kinase GCN2 [Acorus calamus]